MVVLGNGENLVSGLGGGMSDESCRNRELGGGVQL